MPEFNADGTPIVDPANSGEGSGGEGKGSPKEGEGETYTKERFDGLMSNWQKEQDARAKSEEALELAKEELARLQGNNKQDDRPSFMREGWKPKTVEDIQAAIIEATEFGKKSVLTELEGRTKAEQQAKQQVDAFITATKSADKEFNDQAFYDYAGEHKFPVNTIDDLKAVYSSFRAIREARKEGAKSAIENKGKRDGTPVHKPGQGAADYKGTPWSEVKKHGSILEAVHARLGK